MARGTRTLKDLLLDILELNEDVASAARLNYSGSDLESHPIEEAFKGPHLDRWKALKKEMRTITALKPPDSFSGSVISYNDVLDWLEEALPRYVPIIVERDPYLLPDRCRCRIDIGRSVGFDRSVVILFDKDDKNLWRDREDPDMTAYAPLNKEALTHIASKWGQAKDNDEPPVRAKYPVQVTPMSPLTVPEHSRLVFLLDALRKAPERAHELIAVVGRDAASATYEAYLQRLRQSKDVLKTEAEVREELR